MKRKRLIIAVILFLLISILLIKFTDLCSSPKLAKCRTCKKPVYSWNARRVDYHIRINGLDTDRFKIKDSVFNTHMSGFMHKSCNIPIIDIRITIGDDGKPLLDIGKVWPGEKARAMEEDPAEDGKPPFQIKEILDY